MLVSFNGLAFRTLLQAMLAVELAAREPATLRQIIPRRFALRDFLPVPKEEARR